MDTHASSLVKMMRLNVAIILRGSVVGCTEELVSIFQYATRLTQTAVTATQVLRYGRRYQIWLSLNS